MFGVNCGSLLLNYEDFVPSVSCIDMVNSDRSWLLIRSFTMVGSLARSAGAVHSSGNLQISPELGRHISTGG